jgi:hypothetical protein
MEEVHMEATLHNGATAINIVAALIAALFWAFNLFITTRQNKDDIGLLKSDITQLRHEVRDTATEVHAKLNELRSEFSELRSDQQKLTVVIARLSGTLDSDVAKLSGKLDLLLERRQNT